MKTVVKLNDGGHDWRKVNLVTMIINGRHCDKYRCKGCGINGISYTIDSIHIDGRISLDKVNNCEAFDVNTLPKRIRVLKCGANGYSFETMIPGSEHDVISPPKEYKNDSSGVWVMGQGEPIKLLKNEYEIIN